LRDQTQAVLSDAQRRGDIRRRAQEAGAALSDARRMQAARGPYELPSKQKASELRETALLPEAAEMVAMFFARWPSSTWRACLADFRSTYFAHRNSVRQDGCRPSAARLAKCCHEQEAGRAVGASDDPFVSESTDFCRAAERK
jgi:hypothetical protein